MKYSIEITGGFTGIPRQYQGEMTLPTEEEENLMGAMKDPGADDNQYLRDSLLYVIEFTTDGASRKSTFTDATLPAIIRQFMETIRQGKDTTS